MKALQGKGWLIVGAVLAVAVPWAGADRLLADSLDRVLPAPWHAIFTGVLVLFACSAFYFRSHWAAVADRLSDEREHAAGAAEVLREVATDLERSASVLEENLFEALRAPESATAKLYLEGATAHAKHVSVLADRGRAAIARLDPPAEGEE